jgi:hypothetical protein
MGGMTGFLSMSSKIRIAKRKRTQDNKSSQKLVTSGLLRDENRKLSTGNRAVVKDSQVLFSEIANIY